MSLLDGFRFSMVMSTRPAKVADMPLFVDPLHDGAADPTLISNRQTLTCWIFYTDRRERRSDGEGFEWFHGTRLGIAESLAGGATWTHRGEAKMDLADGRPQTQVAPAMVHHRGRDFDRGDQGRSVMQSTEPIWWVASVQYTRTGGHRPVCWPSAMSVESLDKWCRC